MKVMSNLTKYKKKFSSFLKKFLHYKLTEVIQISRKEQMYPSKKVKGTNSARKIYHGFKHKHLSLIFMAEISYINCT